MIFKLVRIAERTARLARRAFSEVLTLFLQDLVWGTSHTPRSIFSLAKDSKVVLKCNMLFESLTILSAFVQEGCLRQELKSLRTTFAGNVIRR